MSRRPKPPKPPSVELRQVQRLADLSRLSLAPQEGERLREELSSILGYFAVLDKVDLGKEVPPLELVKDGAHREDVVRPSTPEEILAGVPQRRGRHVRAPRVF